MRLLIINIILFGVFFTVLIFPRQIQQYAATSYPIPENYTSPYGVTTIHADGQLITDFTDTNTHWIRYQIAGIPNFSQLDADVLRLNAAGIHIDFSVHCLFGSCFSNPPLASVSEYVSAVTQLASRYNGTSGHGFIDAFEIGNEEFDFYSPSTYPPYLKAGCQAVKTASPKALCGMYGTYIPDITHYSSVVNAIFSAGDGQSMDFMNFHYYVHGNDPAVGPPPYPTVIQTFHQIASQNGFANLPIWVTEVGWPTAAVSCCRAVTPQQQSQYLQYVMDQSRTSGIVQRVFWFTMDYGDQADSLDRTSTGRLPAFTTYQKYVSQYPTWTGGLPSPSHSPTQSLTPPLTTTPSGTTTFTLILCPHGLGNCGDNVNANSGGNTNPQHVMRSVNLTLLNANNQPVTTAQGSVMYTSSSQNFQGTLSENISSGQFLAIVKLDGFLAKQIPGIITVSQGQPVSLPLVSLVTGDINNDGQVDILDYNILIGCFGSRQNTASCTFPSTSHISGADINDDGIVNGTDYNLFLRELSVQHGST